jgi:hypothetical protein
MEPIEKEAHMFIAITAIIATTILFALGRSSRSSQDGELIVHRPYNNRYSDAAGAREDHLS